MAAAEISTGATRTAALPERSTWGLIQLALFWVASNFHWAALPIIIVPSQVQAYLYLHRPASVVTPDQITAYLSTSAPGALAAVVGPGLLVALIANPLFGYLSDRTRLRWGRRLPYILGGTLVNLGGLASMALAPNLVVLTLGLMLTQLANNAAAAPFHALLPDLVPASQRGRASGLMGLGQMLGTILGATLPGIVFGIDAKHLYTGTQSAAGFQHAVLLGYGFTAVFILALAVLTVVTVRERPLAERSISESGGAMQHLARDLVFTLIGIGVVVAATLGVMLAIRTNISGEIAQNVLLLPALLVGTLGVARAFDFRPRQHRDFAWVLLTRAIVMMGIYTVLNFLKYYLEFVTFNHVAGAPDPGAAASIFIDITIVTAAISTVFAGALSDRFGRKRMVYISGTFMALVGVIFLVTPLVLPGAAVATTFISAAIFGLGYGAYVSVDWALVTDVLPSENSYARDMGIWNVALTTPQVLAYVIGAFVIAALGGVAFAGYANFGYTMLFVLLVVYAIIGTVTVRNIRGVRR